MSEEILLNPWIDLKQFMDYGLNKDCFKGNKMINQNIFKQLSQIRI